MKQIWDIWPELQIQDPNSHRVKFIQTPDEKWADYFSIWKRAMREDRNTTCPCPIPHGHMMFENVKAPPKPEQKQMELF